MAWFCPWGYTTDERMLRQCCAARRCKDYDPIVVICIMLERKSLCAAVKIYPGDFFFRMEVHKGDHGGPHTINVRWPKIGCAGKPGRFMVGMFLANLAQLRSRIPGVTLTGGMKWRL